MSDDSKTTDSIPAPEIPPSTTAPSVHTGELWGGPQWIENATAQPVWVETKEEYWALLNKTGWTMKNQQESSTGPEAIPEPVVLPEPDPPPAPFTQREAEVIAAMGTLYRLYGLREIIVCNVCFTKNREHRCFTQVGNNLVSVQCDCGERLYRAPKGVNLRPAMAHTAQTLNDRTTGTLWTGSEAGLMPTVLLLDPYAELLRAYVEILLSRRLEPWIYCVSCWRGEMTENASMALNIGPSDCTLLCSCRMIVHTLTKH